MRRKIIVYTEVGNNDSLKRWVKLFFTLTPPPSKGSTPSFDPVVVRVMPFSIHWPKEQLLEWDSSLIFSTYHTKVLQTGMKDCWSDPNAEVIEPGQSRIMKTPGQTQGVVWSDPVPDKYRPVPFPSSATITNCTGFPQTVALHIRNPRMSRYFTCVAYHPVQAGKQIIVPEELLLQVYLACDPSTDDRNILAQGDLKYPLLIEPIPFSTLPASSKWKLSQHRSGEIQLNDSQSGPPSSPVELLERSHEDIRNSLGVILGTLASVQDRLASTEKAIVKVKADAALGQHAIAEMRARAQIDDQPAVRAEAELERLAKSFSRSQDRPLATQNVVANMQQTVSTLDRAFSITQIQVQDSVTVQTKTNARLSPLEESVAHTQDDMSRVRQHMVATQSSSVTQGALNLLEAGDPTGDTVTQPGGPICAAGARVHRLAIPLDEAKDRIFTIRRYLRRMDHRVPAIEEQATNLEQLLVQAREELYQLRQALEASGDLVGTLDTRVTTLEGIARLPVLDGSPCMLPDTRSGTPTVLERV